MLTMLKRGPMALSRSARAHASCSMLVLLTACGPARLVSTTDDGADTSSEDSSAEASSADASESTSEGSESSTGTETTSATEATSAGNFVPDYDLPPGPCDPFEQDCDEGQKCVPKQEEWGGWDFGCVPVLGQGEVGDPCNYDGPLTPTDDCGQDSACWDWEEVEGQLVGTCLSFCEGNWDDPSCPPMSQCLLSSDGPPVLCVPTCDPLAQDCGEGRACYWANGNFNCIFTTQNIPVGEPCGFINDCDVGLGCLTAEVMPDCDASACCGAFCDLGLGDEQCAALPTTSCLPFFEEGAEEPGYEHVGVCIVLPP